MTTLEWAETQKIPIRSVLAVTMNLQDADFADIWQQLLIEIWEKRVESVNYKWLLTAARGQAINYLHKESKRGITGMPDNPQDRPEIVSLESIGEQEASGDIEDTVYLQELHAFFVLIPHVDQRQAAIMHYLEGRSHQEIAAELGITHDNARKLSSRGLEYVRGKVRGEK